MDVAQTSRVVVIDDADKPPPTLSPGSQVLRSVEQSLAARRVGHQRLAILVFPQRDDAAAFQQTLGDLAPVGALGQAA